MAEGGTGDAARPRRRARRVGAALVLAVVSLVAFMEYGDEAVLVPAASGYSVEPAGRIVAGDDGAVVAFPPGEVPNLRFRVPVRNPSRVAMTVRYAADIGPSLGVAPEDEPTKTVRIEPGGTAWLEFAHTDRGCGATVGEGNGWLERSGITVRVTARFGVERDVTLPLPLPYRVPSFALPESCAGGPA